MILPIVLDALYPEMEEASIGSWLVRQGQVAMAGQAIAELITDKVAYEMKSPAEGTILAILSAEKSVVPVGSTLALVGEPGDIVSNLKELLAENRRLANAREASLSALLEATASGAKTPQTTSAQRVRATPAARRLARERRIDLKTVTGSGPEGMITADDIR